MDELLYYDIKTHTVKAGEALLTVSEFRELNNKDKVTQKKWFNDVITFIFFVYSKSKENPYKNLPSKEAAILTLEQKMVVENRKLKDFLEHDKVKACIIAYNKLIKTRTERIRDDLLQEMDETIDRLRKLPQQRRLKVTVEIESEPGTGMFVPKEVTALFDNWEEKMKSYKMIKEMNDLRLQYEKDLVRESSVMEKNKSFRLFEQ